MAAATIGVVLGVADAPNGPALSPKQQFVARERQQIADAQAAPRASKPPETSVVIPPPTPCVPPITLPFPDRLIHVGGQGGPFGSASNFYAVSSWVGSVSSTGPTYAIWSGLSGITSSTPGLSAVDVYIEQLASDGCGVNFIPVGVFTDSGTRGLLTITRIDGEWLQLTSSASTSVYFNLVRDVFSIGVPTPG
ncbi:MAG: hypothetical protein ACRENL_03070 [Candidatus Dormibacteria bacterium]